MGRNCSGEQWMGSVAAAHCWSTGNGRQARRIRQRSSVGVVHGIAVLTQHLAMDRIADLLRCNSSCPLPCRSRGPRCRCRCRCARPSACRSWAQWRGARQSAREWHKRDGVSTALSSVCDGWAAWQREAVVLQIYSRLLLAAAALLPILPPPLTSQA